MNLGQCSKNETHREREWERNYSHNDYDKLILQVSPSNDARTQTSKKTKYGIMNSAIFFQHFKFFSSNFSLAKNITHKHTSANPISECKSFQQFFSVRHECVLFWCGLVWLHFAWMDGKTISISCNVQCAMCMAHHLLALTGAHKMHDKPMIDTAIIKTNICIKSNGTEECCACILINLAWMKQMNTCNAHTLRSPSPLFALELLFSQKWKINTTFNAGIFNISRIESYGSLYLKFSWWFHSNLNFWSSFNSHLLLSLHTR